MATAAKTASVLFANTLLDKDGTMEAPKVNL